MPEKMLTPCYTEAFRCAAAACADTCCRGWRIAVDRDTAERYRGFPDEALRSALAEYVAPNASAKSDECWAEIALQGSACPFLSGGLCGIQRASGEGWLSLTCANYPRNFNRVGGTLEMALDMSCPEAARLALLDPEPMRFTEAEAGEGLRLGFVPSVDARGEDSGGLHGCFGDIRRYTLSLLQNRGYCLEDRLVMLGKFCEELDTLAPDRAGEQAKALIARHEALAAGGGFPGLPGSMPDEPASLFKTIAMLLEYRLKTEAATPRFEECFNQFRLGLQYTNYIPEAALKRNYMEAKTRYYDGFMETHAHMLEHYLVNHAFKTLFPLGPQKCAYQKRMYMLPKGIFEEYTLLSIQYATIKYLLTGMAGYFRESFGEKHALKLIQSFAKNVDQDIPYQQKLLQFFRENGMLNLACAAALIKS